MNVGDKVQGTLTVSNNIPESEARVVESCPEFPHFGANYPDARCIDGYLWDLDSYDNGQLWNGGNDPCPFCNSQEYNEWCSNSFVQKEMEDETISDEEIEKLGLKRAETHRKKLVEKYCE